MAVARSQRSDSTSTTSFEDAIKTGLDRANATLRNVKSADQGAAGSPRRRLHLRVPGEHARDVHPRRLMFCAVRNPRARISNARESLKAAAFAAAAPRRRLDWSESASAGFRTHENPKGRRLRGGCASRLQTPRLVEVR